MINYIVINNETGCPLVSWHETEKSMLAAIQRIDNLYDVEVWEVSRKIELEKRPAIIIKGKN